MTSESELAWFAVRCVFQSGTALATGATTYEERVTLWRAGSAEKAVERAEAEALDYAGTITESPDTYLGIAQSYQLFGDPADGAEIFSLMRDSDLAPKDYLDSFFDTGTERQ